MRVAYPGSFDPLTYGHLDLIKRASKIFKEIVVLVGDNPQKTPLLCLQKRIEIVKKATEHLSNVSVDRFEGLIVNYLQEKGIRVVIRGLRAISDFEYEFQMALTNRRLAPEIETIFMMPAESYSYLSSKLIKEIINLGGKIEGFVPPFVERELLKAKERIE
ncbi:MAG: pantetheine-phosphate adenylyltransferase [Candidatus Omnitrophota bacterium]|nr:MAG: pantetheine-phosphate adenylyltransferase [Candidatus Omnitrophota bacterium]